jgi:hypothetical protein
VTWTVTWLARVPPLGASARLRAVPVGHRGASGEPTSPWAGEPGPAGRLPAPGGWGRGRARGGRAVRMTGGPEERASFRES